jgi:4-hydroxy-3-methylbut-2-enyl diphosphate reductase
MSFIEIKHIHEEILKHYKDAEIYNEICDASRLRQENIKLIPNECDLIVVVGDKKSSNSNKLF